MMNTPVTNSAPSTLKGSTLGKREKTDCSEQAGSDFSSLIASLWFAPPMLQPPPFSAGGQASASPETPEASSLELPSCAALPFTGANLLAEQTPPAPAATLTGSPARTGTPNPIFQTPDLETAEATTTPAPPPSFVEKLGTEMPVDAAAEAYEQTDISPEALPAPVPATTSEERHDTPRPIPFSARGNEQVVISEQLAARGETIAGVPVDPADPAPATRAVNIHDRLLMSEPSALHELQTAPPLTPTPSPRQLANVGVMAHPMTIASARPASASATPRATSKSLLDSESQILVDNNAPAPTLQEQAAQRDANLVAGLLAAATRESRETNPLSAIRRQFAGEFGLPSNGSNNESGADASTDTMQEVQTTLAFARIAQEPAPVVATASPLAAQVVSHIIALAETLNGRPVRSIRLRLQPEELGQVEIQLKRDAQGNISAHLTAEHETSRRALSQSLGQLRETLERAGLTVDRLEVKSETASLTGNSANQNAHPRNQQSQRPTTKLPTIPETEDRQARGAGDHKLLSLSA